MPEYLTPGVYIEEIEIGAKPIEGVSTSTAAFLGKTERGPIDPRLVTSFDQFRRLYGGYLPDSHLAYEVDGFFRNGGSRCYIARIVGDSSEPAKNIATKAFYPGEKVIRVQATKVGEAGNGISVKIDNPADGSKDPHTFILTVYSSESDINGNKFTLSADPNAANYYAKKDALGERPAVTLSCIYSGRPAVLAKTSLAGGTGKTETPSTEDKTASFDLGREKTETPTTPPANVLSMFALGPGESANNIKIKIENAGLNRLDRELFKLIVSYKDIEEVFDNLSIKSSSSDYYLNRVNGISNLVTIKPGTLLLRPDNLESKLEGGKNCEVELQDYEGYIIDESTGKRTGWLALDRISDISIYCEPYEDDPILQSALTDSVISHCELMKDRFAILQTSQKATSDVNAIMPCKDSKYAALYHPWVQILDPITNLPSYIPPCGHMAGIYARIDGDRGVHKAPANVNINGAIGLKFDIKKGEQDILNPRGVNCIRAFQGQGIKIWGARTISRDPLWKYINVRRLFIFLEKSIEQGTQWVVFEPNNEALWSRVKQTISQFLTTAWRSGALMGATEEEAFFVKCDRTTMTQDDIDNGRLIVVVGVAPVKPAEFVIFRIAQVANASNVSE
jgi:phage tail sheath protein FI